MPATDREPPNSTHPETPLAESWSPGLLSGPGPPLSDRGRYRLAPCRCLPARGARCRDSSAISAATAAESVTPQAQQEIDTDADSAAAQYQTDAGLDQTDAGLAPGRQGNKTNKSPADAHADAPAQTQRHTGYTTEPTSSSDSAIPNLIGNSGSSSDVVILSPRINHRELLGNRTELPRESSQRNGRTVRRLNSSRNPRTQRNQQLTMIIQSSSLSDRQHLRHSPLTRIKTFTREAN